MAINKESNGYTFGFAAIMVVIVGALLSLAAIGLKPFQQENLKAERMMNILASIEVEVSMSEAPDNFSKYVTKRIMLDASGKVLSEKEGPIASLANDGKEAFENDPFNVDIKKQYRSLGAGAIKAEDAKYPLFMCQKDGKQFVVVPMVGKGLWGPIWGYIALKDDLNTIFGASLDHKTETPGLGAEIKTKMFCDQFKNDRLFNDKGEFVSVEVIKGSSGDNPHQVDGITGGTITSVGVSDMVKESFGHYIEYFKTLKNS